MSQSPSVFSVASTAELGIREFVLTEDRWQHIMLGHRDLRSVCAMVVQAVVEKPTHIHTSTYDFKRLQFISQNITMGSGRPMLVIIEREGDIGKVITATPKGRVNGQLIWDSATGLHASYDKSADILYVSRGSAREAYAEDSEEDERLWFRYYDDDNSPAGMTIFQFGVRPNVEKQAIIKQISEFLNVSVVEVEGRVGRFSK